MKKLGFGSLLVALTVAMTTTALAGPISLQGVHVNINGAIQNDLTGFTPSASFTLGTLTYVDTRAGANFLDILFNYDLGVPFFNEYGTTVNGAPSAGITWSIDDWSDNSGSPTPGSGAQTNSNDAWDQVSAGGPLLNANLLPGHSSNFNARCASGASCNGDVAGALGFVYTVGVGQKATITITASTAAPPGFALKLIHPVDAGNPTETDLYLSGSWVVEPIPEPGTWILLATGLGGAAALKAKFRLLRRS